MKPRKNISKEKAKKSLFNSESAAATVIAAVLLLAMIFSVLAVVRVEYVPQWKTDAEVQHMNRVQNDMTELKSTVDMVSFLMVSNSNTTFYGFPATVSFSMGGGEIPILEPSKSSGTLSVNDEPCILAILSNLTINGTDYPIIKTIKCGGITYISDNRQYLDQALRYEAGGLILAQGEKSLMRQPPAFNLQNIDEHNYTLSIQAINITGKSNSLSSNTDAAVRLTGVKNGIIYDSNDYTGNNSTAAINSLCCVINTKYPDAWENYLNETSENAGLKYYRDYELYRSSPNDVCLTLFSTNDKKINRIYAGESAILTELDA
ncbi:MAG TPA: hypothetical protein VN278_00850 [Methanosarcina sp.]|nr:hypothetical protein [Methanosarcina sp.]